jgi:broad specificity phosphatase PhoE
MPKRIILVRHGRSGANEDDRVWKTTPDNKINLTAKGRQQARDTGERIAKLLRSDENVRMAVSPFARTLQTGDEMRKAFEDKTTITHIEPRVREQEVGNLQGEDFHKYRKEQMQVGRFFYRFPTGESGCDVCDRTSAWFSQVLKYNADPFYPVADTVVVVTHGLTMRCVLVMLFGWSPNTFLTVWNAENCSIYVLAKDLEKGGMMPYTLDTNEGGCVASSFMLRVKLQCGKERILKLTDYIDIPPPRSFQLDIVKQMLAKQYDGTNGEDKIDLDTTI